MDRILDSGEFARSPRNGSHYKRLRVSTIRRKRNKSDGTGKTRATTPSGLLRTDADATTASSSPAQPREGARASPRLELDLGGSRNQTLGAAVTAFSSFPSVPFHFRGSCGSAGSVTTSRWLPSGGGICVAASPEAPARLGSRAPRPGPPWPPIRSRNLLRPRLRRRRLSHSLHRRRRALGLVPERAGRAAREPAPGTRSSWP